MTRHETIAHITRKSKIEANSQTPHLWPDLAPILSRGAKRLVGKKIHLLRSALIKSVGLGPDGHAELERGTLRWGKNSLSWEFRAYDQHLLYRAFDNQGGYETIRVIFVLTAQEALENLAQEQARLAALRALYWPPKVQNGHEGKQPLRSKRRSAG
ncbi:hypothetical protein GCM10010873_34020 [Cypionkella aquatica]|uniref:Uncharacterized protein n=1 Tax=Cypionkella aquatica TaxID=1756042 RepID=A0AA37X0S3_9RHOB|nr:hypothetical protein [Cypionkella aquatica]GLS88428.1 hypothetical protein GCM10010873_34020 [Cypionkella aquatica]